MIISPVKKIEGFIKVPGDKSISHRAVILGSVAKGLTEIHNLSPCEDCIRTVTAFKNMGIEFSFTKESVIVKGKGLRDLSEPQDVLDLGNSGTSIRLLTGVLSAQSFFSVLTGDQYLLKRPMDRVIIPLTRMGAKISGRANNRFAPLAIKGEKLKSISYTMPVPSAQVKSSIILAGIFAEGTTRITETALTRDHTEIMLSSFGGKISKSKEIIAVDGGQNLEGTKIFVPSDISSAAFLLVAASLLKDSSVTIKDVGINPTRTGILDILKEMGTRIEISNMSLKNGELVADISASTSELHGISIDEEIAPRAIDEFPIIFIAAALAKGKTHITGIKELRIKESDRIATMVKGLKNMGINAVEGEGEVTIEGAEKFRGTKINSFGDHRVAMAFSIAALLADSETHIDDVKCIDTSFPGFFNILESVVKS
ncbi:MAG: 3-phosphoshikimate 1-carboxyvinyltransferase [Candidatus Schekmanbacteria bacterium RIFCSPHIGHO2_02_FULL_38_11]|uniref:3-phosphoshikimate 1-carboxyvinyltransferase n=1 Tax=Candidatus Schekmanbacteria bacterium RIFCSPLOWO2_12_FULL_38_15 TaxID=1817883 RepID=A0A1F7SKI7_9BACT|nr:MAG: 3-phosphoshikimate 1-carboxyvinyltransferase [Candidatus Schekmanbacteria bacterium GWA2_38_9]OGL49272.1 MAG: 3-phosphoshikimate 1-carboxyvinyltransferase [Candidatus Schekmanbacteria bacterium RIFCSPLOWO2_02_FULL_38_14]OGL53727.1 MAG: 3-phosphoshikimate 1-carboxyvinyltransferase [Candidatus Schekmanbacteria bacterium RIFCSPLOWO2_12_FULL_38_15]OGL54746.1 MAG: 3-phosphoshikimate 1-carboxyvinyltransferase [Candidatus Schekmanbacteria bacterium RIFCSPHIGHO2_02_FULL_38_11]